MPPEEKAQRLVTLVEKEFPEQPLGKAEREMLRAAALGAVADRRAGNAAEDDPAGAGKWGADRAVRAKLLRWLCTEHEASGLVDPRGVQVCGVRIDGELDLSCADVPFRLGFGECAFPAGLNLMDARLPGLFLNGSHTGPITADGVTVTGDVCLREKFHATGEVRLLGASVGGDLTCRGGTFANPDANALSADRIQVKGGVFLNEGFRASGTVRLLGASVGGNLACSGGIFEGGKPDGAETEVALGADGIQVTGDVYLDEGFRASGVVRLPGASVGGDLVCRGGTFENPDADALSADNIQVKGAVFLNNQFRASGVVRLLGASVGGNLNCRDGTFENPDADALSADGIQVTGDVFLNEGFQATGEVRLPGASVGGDLACSGGRFENPGGDALIAETAHVTGAIFLREISAIKGRLNLAHGHARVLVDDRAAWPERGRLALDGFTYEAIEGETGAKGRLEWLERQYPRQRNKWRGAFRPQPYDQLAAVLRRMGHEGEARKVQLGKHEHQRKYGTMGKCARAWNRLMGATIGHGYKPQRAFYLLSPFFLLLGYLLFAFVEMHQLDENSAPFSALGYSFDAFFLIVDLHQYDAWEPVCPWARAYVWFHAFCGVILTAALVAGLTGIVKRE